MNGVHDMGGMHGLGPIAPDPDEPIFRAAWEARALALTLAAGAWGRWSLDASRHQRELIPGPDYLRMSYYEKWIAALEALLTGAGLVTPEELATGRPAPGVARADPPLRAEQVAAAMARGGPTDRAVDTPPRFGSGDRIRTRNISPAGHTRLPRYARAKLGVVTHAHGGHVFPDANAHGRGEAPQHLYQVRFEAVELWGPDGDGRSAVYLDLWDAYLDPA